MKLTPDRLEALRYIGVGCLDANAVAFAGTRAVKSFAKSGLIRMDSRSGLWFATEKGREVLEAKGQV